MHLIHLHSAVLFALISLAHATPAPASKPKPPSKPCTIHSPTTGSFFDLSAISLSPPSSKSKDDRTMSWQAKGYDYGANFTMNFCAPVIEDLAEIGGVVGVEESRWGNISAFYEYDGDIFSIGQQSSTPLFRGRKLVLNYTNGSPCPSLPKDHLRTRSPAKKHDDDDDDDKPENKRTKSTIISFLCDPTPLSSHPSISFVGTPDSCSYFFEVRSSSSCGGHASDKTQTLSPVGVFGIIAGIAIAAYLIGGCAYQRIVLNQRGWRQVPNYSVWKGCLSFCGVSADTCCCCFPRSGRGRWKGEDGFED